MVPGRRTGGCRLPAAGDCDATIAEVIAPLARYTTPIDPTHEHPSSVLEDVPLGY